MHDEIKLRVLLILPQINISFTIITNKSSMRYILLWLEGQTSQKKSILWRPTR